ncbi:MAG: SO_0444 family Cu/Zn efflux transporter [Candidatus Kapabacteria bacterium]|nr:SO_0444 family Cu/Zn efflux transporter [Candidatus Kapabacteria bacterium]
MEYLMPLWKLMNEMAPYLLLGFLFAGVLHVVVPRAFYRKYFSNNSLRSVFYASLFGIPLPLCSCGVIPTAMSLRREGASRGATVAFLTSTPQTGIDSILATFAVFGVSFTIMRPLAALVTSVLVGWVENRININESSEHVEKQSSCELDDSAENPKNSSVFRVLRYGYFDMLQDIGGHLLVGLVLAAIITVFVPDSFFLQFAEYPLLEMLAVLLVAAPMYVCATGSIPIAAALMLKGISPGAALVFLMAGPATNIASLLVIKKVLGNKTMYTYLLGIICGAIFFGLMCNLLPAEWFAVIHHTADCCCVQEIPIWKQILTLAFLALLANALIHKFINRNNKMEKVENQVTYKVVGMNCNHCKAGVENALKKLSGVENAVADVAKAEVVVTGKVSDDEVREAVTALGFEYKGKC